MRKTPPAATAPPPSSSYRHRPQSPPSGRPHIRPSLPPSPVYLAGPLVGWQVGRDRGVVRGGGDSLINSHCPHTFVDGRRPTPRMLIVPTSAGYHTECDRPPFMHAHVRAVICHSHLPSITWRVIPRVMETIESRKACERQKCQNTWSISLGEVTFVSPP